jgi:hypothetical protein
MSTNDTAIRASRDANPDGGLRVRPQFSTFPPPGYIHTFYWPHLDKNTPVDPGSNPLNVHDCAMDGATLYLYADGTFWFGAYWSGNEGDVWIIRRFVFFSNGGQVGDPTRQYDAPGSVPPGQAGHDLEWTFSDQAPGVTATNAATIVSVSMVPHC